MLPPQLSTSKISPMTSQQIAAIAARNTEKARRIIRDTGIIDIWESAGAEINLVGSLSTGLFMKHRDIDFHIYSAVLRPEDDFTALAKLAANPAVKRIEYGNLLATEERCLEWHAWYEDQEGELWQLDMIHIEKGSRYDGYFEEVARRISAALTDETREAILRLKWETPDTEKIAGIEYYMAVLRDGIRSYPDFVRWREAHPLTGLPIYRVPDGCSGVDALNRIAPYLHPAALRYRRRPKYRPIRPGEGKSGRHHSQPREIFTDLPRFQQSPSPKYCRITAGHAPDSRKVKSRPHIGPKKIRRTGKTGPADIQL